MASPAVAPAGAVETTSRSPVQPIPVCDGDMSGIDAVGNETYGGEDDDIVYDVARGSDQLFLGGATKSYNGEPELRQTTSYDGWVVALHPNGTEKWNESYGDDSGHSGYAITSGYDGGALLVGTANEAGTNEKDGWAVRISADGSVVWNRTFGDRDEYDRLFDAAPAPGGGFYLVGETTSLADNRFESEHSDAWLLEVNESGHVLSERVFGGYNRTYGKSDSFTGIHETADGYLVSGRTASLTPKTYSAVWVTKLDETGEEVWNHTYANGRDKDVEDLYRKPTGELVAVGRSDETDEEGGWLASLGTNGELRWDRTYGGSIDRFTSIAAVDRTGYLVAGSTWSCSSEDSYADFSLVKIRPNTSVKWASNYGGPRADQAYRTVSPRTGRLWITGSTSSFGDNGWIVQVPIDPDVPPVADAFRPPRDPDADSLFEDVNGDGNVTVTDVQDLFAARDSETVRTHVENFDFDDDGDVDVVDVQALFAREVASSHEGPAPTAGATTVSLSPDTLTTGSGASATVGVVAAPDSAGVGAFNVTLRTNASIATITNASANGTSEESPTAVEYAADNSSVTVAAALLDTVDAGSVTVATLTVTGRDPGTADIDVTVNAIGNETGSAYAVSSVANATIEVPSRHESGVSRQVYAAVADDDGLSRSEVLSMVRAYVTSGSLDGISLSRADVLTLVQYYVTQ